MFSVPLLACSSEEGEAGADAAETGSGGERFDGTGGEQGEGSGGAQGGATGGSSSGGGQLSTGGMDASSGGASASAGGADAATGGSPAGTGGIENPGGEPGGSDTQTCADTEDWDEAWSQLEEDILIIVNEERAKGATCGGESYPPIHPLKMDPALRCAARLHSKDMVDRDFFSHDNPSDESPWDRIDAAGYEGNASGENIAAGNGTAAATMNQWMNSPGHCSNIMSKANFIGVGYYPGGDYRHMWTQTFGR